MASESLRLFWGALRILLLCTLMLLPVFKVSHGGLVGGWHDRSVSDPAVQKMVAFAVDDFNKRSNSLFYSRPLEILKAQSQVVEGVKYSLKVLLVKTQCDKRSRRGLVQGDLDGCRLPPEAEQERQICKFYVWSRPWLNDTRLMNMSCGPADS